MTDTDHPEGDTGAASLFGDAPMETSRRPGYLVLARKYRPSSFEDLVGQDAMVRTLENAFRTGRIAHAFMLTGVRGVGKTTTARLLARALNYVSDEAAGPSMRLSVPGRHCAAIMAGSHPDVMELDAASRTGVGDMRELLDGTRYAPVSARYKVYIIDEVHMLSTAAFNALLKTLEEPPPHVKFIFATTEIRKVPVTVLSRCQRFNLQRFTPETLAAHLGRVCEKEGASVAPEALALIARAAEGSARDGLSILDQVIVQAEGGETVSAERVRDMLGMTDRSRLLDLLERAIAGDHRAALVEASSQLQAGIEASLLLRDLLELVVDVSRAQALGDAFEPAGPSDWTARTRAIAARLSPAQASRAYRILLVGFQDCTNAPDPSSAAEMVVLRLSAACALPPPEDAVRMLGAGVSAPPHGPSGAPERDSRPGGGGGASASAVRALRVQPDVDEAPGPVLATLAEMARHLEAQRAIDLLYDLEHFVRPVEVGYGVLRYAAAPGAPRDLAQRLKGWLQRTTGVEWDVDQTNTARAESVAEIRARRRSETIAAAESHPRVREALGAFPGARILSVATSGAESDPYASFDPDEEAADDNVLHVDFTARPATQPPAMPAPVFGIEAPVEEDDE